MSTVRPWKRGPTCELDATESLRYYLFLRSRPTTWLSVGLCPSNTGGCDLSEVGPSSAMVSVPPYGYTIQDSPLCQDRLHIHGTSIYSILCNHTGRRWRTSTSTSRV